MSKKKSSRSSGIVGFFVALLLLGFVIFAGQTDYLGPISADLRAEFSALYTRSTVDYELTAAKLLAAVGVLCLIYLVCRILRLLLKLFSRSARTRTVNELVGSIITYLAVILGIVWALTILGLDPTAAFASLGIVTLIVGFAAQRLIEDVISGLFIVLEGQYNVGDIIILDDFRGTVKRIGVRTTTVVDLGGNYKVVNNSDIRNFQNRSRVNSLAICLVGVSYSTDLMALEKMLEPELPAMYERNKDLYLGPPRYYGVEELGDNGVTLKIVVPTKESTVFAARRRLNRDIRVLFEQKGIEIPFPQVVVHRDD